MADPQTQEGSDDLLEEPSTNDFPSFNIYLVPVGDGGSNFRTRNDPSSSYQRGNAIQRDAGFSIHCSFLDVVHGLFSAESETFATLLVLQFQLYTSGLGRRFVDVNISLAFESEFPGGHGLEVSAIAPMGRMISVPTTQQEDIKRDASLQPGGTVRAGGATETGTVAWKRPVESDTRDEAAVVGSIQQKGRNWGKPNCAYWFLSENKTTKTGIPTSMRMAVLLKRENDNPFHCEVSVHAHGEFHGVVQEVAGREGWGQKGDPIVFEPDLEETDNSQKYDTEELGALNLESVI